MTLWNLYSNRQPPPSPPLRRPEGMGLAPQSEALNLGVHREMARQERERDEERERECELVQERLYEIDDNPKRKEFLDDLFRFMHNRGTPISRLPIMAKQVLDMYELYNLVVARGGLVEVINKKLWQEIIKGLKLPSSITSAAFTLRTQYMKYLYPQECQKENLSSPSDLQAAIDGNRREGRRGGYSNASYADFVQRSPLMASSMAQSFG
ncbi:protein dead ringer homolog, partial [Pollicipes pollicipes]|uniref:protein dead ringer homolog n=1 Tax=Pollicipes pollicipes TaxID=41117 RepID=UPI00188493B5